ncbi:OTU domain-containing protein 5-A [Thelohanellus kitauei]|uniref:ubiquitinyl hydrolase 1 n=1 Tax=Thelohanellus kitauei TaxID=669202 RepID=A0A0C2JZF8_THEKT|nr:OTU domain-containing protein 5-A [Thelohanellus kitauei]
MTIEPLPEHSKCKRPHKKSSNPTLENEDCIKVDRSKKKKISDKQIIIGNNSEDECDKALKNEISTNTVISKPPNLEIYEVKQDGSCLFRAISYLMYGDEEHHLTLRQRCIKYIDNQWSNFRDFITEDKYGYLQRKSLASCYGNHIEITALSSLLNVQIQIYDDNLAHISTIGQSPPDNSPRILCLCYRNRCHYDAVIDVNHPIVPVVPPSPEREEVNCVNEQPEVKTDPIDESDTLDQVYITAQIQMAEMDDVEQQILEAVRQQSILEQQNLGECVKSSRGSPGKN